MSALLPHYYIITASLLYHYCLTTISTARRRLGLHCTERGRLATARKQPEVSRPIAEEVEVFRQARVVQHAVSVATHREHLHHTTPDMVCRKPSATQQARIVRGWFDTRHQDKHMAWPRDRNKGSKI